MSGVDVFVVVRAAGERTEATARRLAEEQVGAGSVTTIREVPFATALRRGFEIGVEAGARWTLCLDADVLPRPGAIADLVAAADTAPENAFGTSGLVADKLLCHWRPAGQHLYRTELLGRALAEASFDPAKRRPETVVKKFMARDGHPTVETRIQIGLHDFEQSYADIFRKIFVHTLKHGRFMEMAERAWLRQAPDDPDFRVALVSAAAARAIAAHAPPPSDREDEVVRIDRRDFSEEIDALLRPMQLREKAALAAGEPDTNAVSAALDRFGDAPEYVAARTLIEASTRGPGASLLAHLRHHGAASPIWIAGAALERSGSWLRQRLDSSGIRS